MTWSYSGDPSASPKDAVRFAIGDTRQGMPQLTDEEISALLAAAQGNVKAAAIAACRAIMFTLGRNRDESVGQVSISFSQQFDHYRTLLADLQGQVGLTGDFVVYAGGVSRSDNFSIDNNPDNVRPNFRRVEPRRLVPAGLLADSSPYAWEALDDEQHH